MTVIVSVLAPSVTESTTAQIFALFPEPQPGVSKSGAEENVSTPVLATMLNKSWSTDAASVLAVTMEYVWVAVPSLSVAVYVPTAVEPSATLTAEADPAENTGSCSFRSVTVAVTVIVSVLVPSDTVSTTVQTLVSSPAPQPGFS